MLGGDLLGVTIGYVPHSANPHTAADVEANTQGMLGALHEAGAHVAEVTEAIDWIELESRMVYQASFTTFARLTCRVGRTPWTR